MVEERSVTGCLLGAAVGDAIGLPAEGLPLPSVLARNLLLLLVVLGHGFRRMLPPY